MKTIKAVLALTICCALSAATSIAQDLNWTFPNQYYDTDALLMYDLPQPSGSDVYSGDPSLFVHAAYSNPDGSLKFFTSDEFVYDGNGHEVGRLFDYDGPQQKFKEGFNERLILPMGEDCKRFAIIYRSRVGTLPYNSPLSAQTVYMGVYDVEGLDNPNATGALETYGTNNRTLVDIGARDGLLYHQAGLQLYGYNDLSSPTRQSNMNVQIAASELIDGCYYRVYVFDGNNLIKYHLTSSDLEYQGVIKEVPRTTATATLRTEMELIKLSNGNYRIAIPTSSNDSGGDSGITIYDINGSTGDVINGTEIYLDYENSPGSLTRADLYGIEFTADGRYLYITNGTNTVHTNLLEVYDFNTSSYVGLPNIPMASVSAFQESFIERFGNNLYLASTTNLGQLTNAAAPGTATFNGTFRSLAGTYGNDLNNSSFQRQLLPEQLDMSYPEFVDMSCECCLDNISDETSVVVSSSATWSPGGGNPYGTGSDIYIRDELRIEAGVTLTLNNLNFYFGPDARVIVEAGNGATNGGYLIMNNTKFTADLRCNDKVFPDCDGPEQDCDDLFWQGVEVEGVASVNQAFSGGIQGRLRMRSNSEIEFAFEGVKAGLDGCSTCGGGILDIRDSKFKDNITGVKFDPYVRTSNGNEVYNYSYIRNTNFTRTSDIPANSKLTHVTMSDCSEIRLRGNIYQNEAWQSYNIDDRGKGIISFNSMFSDEWYCSGFSSPCSQNDIVRSEFLNLEDGIWANSSASQRTAHIFHAYFENNRYGISLNGMIAPMVLDNDFLVMNYDNSFGLFLNASTGYAVENNYFTSLSASPVEWNYGIAIWSSGEDANEIYKNTFERITSGIISQKSNARCSDVYNTGLRWKCNTFNSQIAHSDIYVQSGNVSNVQGQCNFQTKIPAGNLFSHTGGGAYDLRMPNNPGDVIVCQGYQLNVDYWYHDQSSPPGISARYEPLTYSSILPHTMVPQVCTGILAGRGTCPVQNTSLPGRTSKSQGAEAKSLFDEVNMDVITAYAEELYAAINSISDEDVETRAIFIDREVELWNTLIRAHQRDSLSIFPTEEVFSLIAQYEPEYGVQRYAAVLAYELGLEQPSWISSSNSLNSFNAELEIALSDNETLPEFIPEYFNSNFFDSASNSKDLNALYASYGDIYHPYLPDPNSDFELPESYEVLSGLSSSNDELLHAYTAQPNPFNDVITLLTVMTDQEVEDVRITIHDAQGKLIYDKVTGSKDFYEIDGMDFPLGVLIATIYHDGVFIETRKIVKMK
jgi:hypothetical protein